MKAMRPKDRPLSRQEAMAIGFEKASWLVEIRDSARLIDVGGYLIREELILGFMDSYGSGWRIWWFRPTKEMRKAASWETIEPNINMPIARDIRGWMRPYHDAVRRALKARMEKKHE